jgi:rhamnogalacturonan endolyase
MYLISRSAAVLLGSALVMGLGSALARAQAAPVTASEDDAFFTLDNGIIKALVSKKSGDLVSMKFKGVEMFATTLNPDGSPNLTRDPPGDPGRGMGMTDHMYGFWSHDAVSDRMETKITLDPKTNAGARAEVSVKAFSDGKKLGHGPGAPRDGDFAADIDIRYALGAGDTGVYTYCAFDHKPEYPDATMGEARFCMKLNNTFDYMLIDEHHHMLYPLEMERNGDNKYNYTSVQYEHPAFGFASAANKTGCFIVNASVEYLTGPPTKTEFLCHRDTTGPNYFPCVLNYWRSSHYGGGGVDVAKGEAWTKVIGPFLLYCNTGDDPEAIWKDAIAKAATEKTKWPYDWVNGVDYPHKDQRSTVSGELVLTDPILPTAKMTRLLVGLAHPDYHITTPRNAATNAPADIIWQTDSKHYEFWAEGNPETGAFSVPAVRAGKYTLHAFAYGVLGEFAKTDITVEAGKPLDLGKLTWTPVRKGKQLWDIGIPNRSGREYVKGDDYFHDGMAAVYSQMFPNDVNYTIGKSDFTKDWFYAQYQRVNVPAASVAVPATMPTTMPTTIPTTVTATGPATTPATNRGGFGRGGMGGMGGGAPRGTTWTINFDLAQPPKGKATLRFGIATANTSQIQLAINDQPAGALTNLPTDSALGRNGIQGIWYEREIAFDAALMKPGANTAKLTISSGGIIYDYLRLELNESAAP